MRRKKECLEVMQVFGLFENGKTFSPRSTEMAAKASVAKNEFNCSNVCTGECDRFYFFLARGCTSSPIK